MKTCIKSVLLILVFNFSLSMAWAQSNSKELEVVSIQDVQGEPDPFDIILEIGKDNKRKKILIDKPELAEINAIKEELKSFYNAIAFKKHPIVSVEDGYSAMEVAYGILAKLEKSPIHF